MTIRPYFVVAALCVATASLLQSCQPAEEEDSGPSKPKAVTFEGKVEPKLVGSWLSADGKAGLDLRSDGSAEILASSDSPSGPVKNHLKGSWLTDGDNLLLKYSVAYQPATTIAYPYQLSGKTLTLTSSNGTKTAYQKKEK